VGAASGAPRNTFRMRWSTSSDRGTQLQRPRALRRALLPRPDAGRASRLFKPAHPDRAGSRPHSAGVRCGRGGTTRPRRPRQKPHGEGAAAEAACRESELVLHLHSEVFSAPRMQRPRATPLLTPLANSRRAKGGQAGGRAGAPGRRGAAISTAALDRRLNRGFSLEVVGRGDSNTRVPGLKFFGTKSRAPAGSSP